MAETGYGYGYERLRTIGKHCHSPVQSKTTRRARRRDNTTIKVTRRQGTSTGMTRPDKASKGIDIPMLYECSVSSQTFRHAMPLLVRQSQRKNYNASLAALHHRFVNAASRIRAARVFSSTPLPINHIFPRRWTFLHVQEFCFVALQLDAPDTAPTTNTEPIAALTRQHALRRP